MILKERIEEKLDNIKENTEAIRKSLNQVTNHEISIPEIDIIKYDTSNGEKELQGIVKNLKEMNRSRYKSVWNLKEKLVELIKSRKYHDQSSAAEDITHD